MTKLEACIHEIDRVMGEHYTRDHPELIGAALLSGAPRPLIRRKARYAFENTSLIACLALRYAPL